LAASRISPACSGSTWQQLPAGEAAKGQRWYDWAWLAISDPGPGCRHLLIRRNRATGELAFYRCYSQHQVTVAALVKVAGLRWPSTSSSRASMPLLLGFRSFAVSGTA
jgi:hypothetical protein